MQCIDLAVNLLVVFVLQITINTVQDTNLVSIVVGFALYTECELRDLLRNILILLLVLVLCLRCIGNANYVKYFAVYQFCC